MRNFRSKLAVMFFLLVETASVVAQPTKPFALGAIPFSDDYVLRNWGVYDGLPSNNIFGIAQTPDGYLWLATRHGLARFDGLRFTCFFKKTVPGLESDDVRSVFVARNGSLWLSLGRGGVGGVERFDAGRFQPIIPTEPTVWKTLWATNFAEDREGGVWFGADPDLKAFRSMNGQIVTYSSQDFIGFGYGVFLYAEPNGTIWFATNSECGVFDGTHFKLIDSHGGADQHKIRGHIAPSRSGGIWAVRDDKLLRYHADGTIEVVANVGNLVPNVLYEDRSGDLWLGCRDEGLLRFHNGGFERIPTTHRNIASIMEDREGNLWVGTFGGGLDRLSARSFSLRRLENGLRNESVMTLCADSEGRLWLAGYDSVPIRALDSTNRFFAALPTWPGGAVMDLYANPAGDVWFGEDGGALTRWHNGIFAPEQFVETIVALLQDREGNMWLSTNDHLVCHVPGGSNTNIQEEGGLIRPRALAQDSAGSIWVGTEDGLVFQRQKNQFVPVPLLGDEPNGQIRFIVPDVGGAVWIGAYSGGLYRCRDGQVKHLADHGGLPMEDLRVMTIEPDGNFWFGTGRGLFRVKREELEAAVDGTLSSLHATSYGRNEGMPSVDFSFGFRNTVARTPDGHLWFATYSGALEVDPQKLKVEFPRASVLVEEIQLNGKTLGTMGDAKLSLPPNPGAVQIHYTLPDMVSPEQIRFRYRLVGLGDHEWVEAGDQRMANFANLPPGDYRFEVAAAMAAGPWASKVGAVSFSVQAAWWQTTLFRFVAFISAFLAVAWTVRAIELRRVRARVRRLEQEHALERERTRIARDIHDEFGANLTQISIASHLAQLEPPESALQHIKDVTAIARNTIKLLGEIVWAVNPRCDTLDALINYVNQYAVNLLSTAGIACEVDVPRQVPAHPLTAEARHHLFLVVKEALNNLVKYAGAKVVQLKVEILDNRLRIVISDDGCGFEMGSERTGSNGLRNMRERMSEIGGQCQIESIRGQGTRVTLEFPLRAAP